MQLSSNIFVTPHGRIRRRTFYWAFALVLLVFCVLYTFIDNAISHAATLILYPPALWAFFVLACRRLHDREQNGWWLLLACIPVFGPLLLGAWLFLGRGTRGDNRFGPDPRSLNADYLTVSMGP
jgi:uncharacterized membrane protein YhaH (DUF805 family)